MRSRILVALILLGLATAPVGAQGDYFGQNQVQFKKFRWQVLRTEHFDVHYYDGIEEIARYTGQMAERTYARLRRVMNHEFRERKPILIYGSRNEFAQNNVTGDLGEGTGGATDPLRQRNMFFYTGDMRESERVLAHEMVHVFQFDIFASGRAGGGMQQLSQVNPPLWFMEGMAEYLAIGPDHPYTDAIIRDAALNGKVPSIEQMTMRPDLFFPYRFGESFWQYVAGRWGDEIVGEILNATPTLGIDRAFRRYTGLDIEDLGEEWKEAMQERYLPQVAELERPRRIASPMLTQRRTGGLAPVYVAPALSPDGRQIVFVSLGSLFRAEVFLDLYLADATTGERISRLTKSTLNPEFEELRYGYSQSSFSPDGRQVAFTAQRAGRDVIYLYDLRRKRVVQRLDTPLQAMIGPSWSPDGRRIVFSGTQAGMTDLYIIDVDGRNLQRLTQDPYGDVQPQWSPDGRRIVFASERGPQSDLSRLDFGKWRINVLDLETSEVTVLPGQDAKNLNPMWSPDGESVAFVSDRTGIPQIFLYDFANSEHYQLTKFVGGVFSVTEHSPAMTWARDADKLAFTYHDDGNFSIWSIVEPRNLKKDPYREPAPRVVAGAAMSSTDSAAVARANAISNIAEIARAQSDSIRAIRMRPEEQPRRRSAYLGPEGWRPTANPPARTGPTLSVAALLDSAELALPDAASFTTERYKGELRPEYVSRPQIGYSQDNFGRGVYGATAIVLSDLVGNRRMIIAGGVNGRISEAQLFAMYMNLGSRQQWAAGVQQQPYFFLQDWTQQQFGNIVRQKLAIARFIARSAIAQAQYPLNRFTRVEYGASLNNVDRSLMFITQEFDLSQNASNGAFIDSTVNAPSMNYAAPFVAFVSDNSLTGLTGGGIYGRRYRFSIERATGNVNWTTLAADYRRYDALIFSYLTVATRIAGNAAIGSDEASFPKYIGRPDFLRGYDRETYGGANCGTTAANLEQCAAEQLLGSRVVYANAELRFPLLRRVDFGILPITLPPLDGLFFYDAGIAWTDGQELSFGRPDNYDLVTQRHLLRSYGFGLRLNLFNIALVRWDYSIPLDGSNRKGYWIWTLGPSF